MSFVRDPGNVPYENIDSFAVAVVSPTAFAGGTANSRGDDGGTNDPFTLFTVTGEVLVRIFGVCTTDLAGATATLEVGVTGNTALLIPQSTATDIDANDIWFDATPTEVRGVALASIAGPFVLVNSSNILETVGTADVTSGNIRYACLWRPLSRNGNLVPAV